MTTRPPKNEAAATDSAALRSALSSVEALAAEALPGIVGIAKLALAGLDSPNRQEHLASIRAAITAISNTAEQLLDNISYEAQEVIHD